MFLGISCAIPTDIPWPSTAGMLSSMATPSRWIAALAPVGRTNQRYLHTSCKTHAGTRCSSSHHRLPASLACSSCTMHSRQQWQGAAKWYMFQRVCVTRWSYGDGHTLVCNCATVHVKL
eukprot:652437-Prorocentrum_minimum.AAC.5